VKYPGKGHGLDETVQPGEKVLTSGGDQIFPEGLPMEREQGFGRTESVSETFACDGHQPEAKLEEVLVIPGKEERPAASRLRLRCAKPWILLSQRLPSVPESH